MFNMKIYGLTTEVNVHVVEKEEYNKNTCILLDQILNLGPL